MANEIKNDETMGFESLLAEVDANNEEQVTDTAEDKIEQTALDPLAAGEVDIDTYMDIVFCIDVTQSMQPTIDKVKAFATSLYDELVPYMLEKCHREVKVLRVKVLAYRDFFYDGRYALEESEFFKLPEDNEQFKAYVGNLTAKGGLDDPESSLEALALAMKSDWVKIMDLNTQRSRHVIVLFTDDEAHRFEEAAKFKSEGKAPHYPADMPTDLNALTMMWQGQGACDDEGSSFAMDKRAKRLIVFAPEDSYPWNEIQDEWESTVVLPMEKGGGGLEVGREVIINTIGNTL